MEQKEEASRNKRERIKRREKENGSLRKRNHNKEQKLREKKKIQAVNLFKGKRNIYVPTPAKHQKI